MLEVSVRELRNHTARVMRAVESGELVVLTVHGRPVADIQPHAEREASRPLSVVVRELNEIAELARQLDVQPRPADYDLGWTAGDLVDEAERTSAR